MDRLEQLAARREAILNGAFMSASEALTWIAFREPDPLAWQEDTKTYGRIGAALPGLSMPDAFELVRQVKQLVPLDTPELQIVAREVAVARERQGAIVRATSLLLAEIGKEKVTAFGRLDKWGAQAPHSPIPVIVFMDGTVTITLRNRVQQDARLLNGGINRGPGYRDVQVKTAEVLAIWPKIQSAITRDLATPPQPALKPPSEGEKMQAALKELLSEGQRFPTAVAAHRAVMRYLRISGEPRGYSYKTFARVAGHLIRVGDP